VRFRWNDTDLRHLTRDIEHPTTIRPDATDEENRELWEELRALPPFRRAEHRAPRPGRGAVAPEVVGTDDRGFKNVDNGRLSAFLVEAARLAALETNESRDA
jgi:hypothetical protein